MKASLFAPVILLAACAPKAIPVDEADIPKETPEEKPAPQVADQDLPPLPHNDGLLDPRSLTQMPTQADMKSPAGDEASAVIANPPTSDE